MTEGLCPDRVPKKISIIILHIHIERFQIGVFSKVDDGVQLCPQVRASPVGHRDQQHYVRCENTLRT